MTEPARGSRFHGSLSFDPTGRGGLSRLATQSAAAQGEIYLQGSHVTRWRPDGHDDVLFMSGASQFEDGAPIRGGIPLVFPWFGAHGTRDDVPNHGFARRRSWDLIELSHDESGTLAAFRLNSDDATREQWEHDFEVTHTVRIGQTLDLQLTVENRSADALHGELVWHTYFAVADVRHVSVAGLEGTPFVDMPTDTRHVEDEAIRFGEETDRLYVGSSSPCTIVDPGLERRIVISRENAPSTVVWNPWVAKAARMGDFGDDEWPHMVCVETGCIGDDAIRLEPGSSWTARTSIGVEHVAP